MSNNTHNQNMFPLEFVIKTVNPQNLSLHPLLSSMGCDNEPDEFFKAERNALGCKNERPIIDTDGNVLTHSAEVLYAKESGVEEMEVYEVNLTDIQRRRLIAHKHRYNKVHARASYETSSFFKSYLTETEEGKAFAENLPGKTTREKIAGLLNTSDSTIKRLWFVGDHMPEEFGLISENNSSLKEAEQKVKLMLWKKGEEERKRATTAQVPCEQIQHQDLGEGCGEDSEDGFASGTIIPTLPSVPSKPADGAERRSYDKGHDESAEEQGGNFEEPIGDCQNSTATSYSFTKGSFEIKGMGSFQVNVTDNSAQLAINGRQIDGAQFIPIANLDPEKFANVNSFIFQEPKHKGLNIQIIVSNFSAK